jgi:transcriptional regulator with XRE-family HTH domain
MGEAMAANDRLRSALNAAGLTPQDVAERLEVDPKTVARWVTLGRAPYPKYRAQLAALLRESESYLWPDAVSDAERERAAESEIVHVYAHRAGIPADVWPRLFASADESIDVLVYAALFLPEQHPKLMGILCDKAEAGARIRVLLGDPDCEAVAVRSDEEGIGRDTIGVKIRNALTFYRPHVEHGCLDVRLHRTTLYTSLYRADDEMLVNHHVYGLPAAHAPVMHLRRLPAGDLFTTFAETFERIWSTSVPAFAGGDEAVA